MKNREIVDVLKADSGREIFIYETRNYKLHTGSMYEVEYKLGLGTEVMVSRLVDTTENDRTLIFNHPDITNKTIGIPNWNIINLTRL
jgi:hypothetical protein